jgi:hypothetical protein
VRSARVWRANTIEIESRVGGRSHGTTSAGTVTAGASPSGPPGTKPIAKSATTIGARKTRTEYIISASPSGPPLRKQAKEQEASGDHAGDHHRSTPEPQEGGRTPLRYLEVSHPLEVARDDQPDRSNPQQGKECPRKRQSERWQHEVKPVARSADTTAQRYPFTQCGVIHSQPGLVRSNSFYAVSILTRLGS